MLHPSGIGVADRPAPIFPFAHPGHDKNARIFEPFIVAHFTDEEAWAALFTDEQRLALYRAIHGNRKGAGKKARLIQPTRTGDEVNNGVIEHHVSLEGDGLVDGERMYRSVCSCGWRCSTAYRDPDQAARVAMGRHGVAPGADQLGWDM